MVFSACSGRAFGQIDYKGFPEWGFNTEGSTQYYLYTPDDIDTTQVYPIAIFLHGCCGEDNNASLRNCVDPPVRMWHNFGKNTQKVPTYIISPATSSGWSQHFTNLVKVIDDLIRNHHGDSTRVYITGFSMGGRGTYDFINQYPNLFAAAIPMGMSFSGSMERAKDIPFWANVGELDSYGDGLGQSVASLRALNGDPRGSDNWVTGVNPRLTIFEGVGHGVQWDAASSQDLVGWALEHVNDGNSYPNIYFSNLEYGQYFQAGETVNLEIVASDNDGSVDTVKVIVNSKPVSMLVSEPYNTTTVLLPGDNILEAVARDNLGKKSTARILLRVDSPPVITSTILPEATQGALYKQQIHVAGNAPFTFSVDPEHDPLPDGITLSTDGLLKGVPVVDGNFTVQIDVSDNENDFVYHIYDLTVNPKGNDEVLVTNLSPDYIPVSKLFNGEYPVYRNGTEISISDVSAYGGLTFIAPSVVTANSTSETYLSFDIDEDATVYVAYEVMDNLSSSTIPQWLSEGYTKQPGQITAQYRYFDVYSRDFPAGRVTIPGPDAVANNVTLGYFIMIKKSGAPSSIPLKLTTRLLPKGYLYMEYSQQLSFNGGQGDLSWEVNPGSVPAGLSIDEAGFLKGYPAEAGEFSFGVRVSDKSGNADSTGYILNIAPEYLTLQKLNHLDTAFLVNSGNHTLTLSNLLTGPADTSAYSLTASTFPVGIISNEQPLFENGSYRIAVNTLDDITGMTRLFMTLTDRQTSGSEEASASAPIVVKILPFVNLAPECNPVNNIVTGMGMSSVKHQVTLTGINDGNDGSQNISVTVSYSNPDILKSAKLTYKYPADSAVFTFYPKAAGSTQVSFLIRDDGGTDLNGVDSLVVEFNISISETGIADPAAGGMKIFPNPAADELNIVLPGNLGKAAATLYNLNGKAIVTGTIEGKGRLDLAGCLNGYYVLWVVTDKKTYRSSVVINK